MTPPDSQPHPVVNPHKWTTKVNIAIVLSATVILALGFLFALWVGANRGERRNEMDGEFGRKSQYHHPNEPPSAPA